jgi:KaiC/GvpD/RAD55 family RecA-like ATPase
MKKNEKRGAPRVPYISEVVCEGAGTRLIARTSDLSVSGVFIHSKLCCEPGSILRLKFSVTSTEIETIGEVCYSIPQIGMGVRFLDLKPDYHTVISTLIEKQCGDGESEKNNIQGRRIIPSGVEPVDKLLGGLERGQLYLAHGEASGKSLFGIEFLIEGLRNGQHGALITTHLRVDAVRRFARLGYDCLGDIRRGSLVLFKYSPDISEDVLRLRHLEPLLRELEPVLDKSSPERMVLDPVNNLLAGRNQDDVTARSDELAVWVRSFGATVVLVANGENCGVIESLTPSVKESFRFGVKESCDRVIRYIAFEKTLVIPDQAVRVDPSRGIFLLEDQPPGELPNDEPGLRAETLAEFDACRGNGETVGDVQTHDAESENFERAQTSLRELTLLTSIELSIAGLSVDSQTETGKLSGEAPPTPLVNATDELTRVAATEEACDEFFAMLDELQSFALSPDPDVSEPEDDALRPLNTQCPDQGSLALQPTRLD